ncbi:unnamed protein product [Bursaphelenchus okinawaensis]|uniref:C2H2-type domain-containing protein n=1 Tax=Bursaphelenchus okinawaensis TaxID=465554 RepID=A0A811LQ33_9BILA|nr:unnamed protein product [Bursaphelenchus okinawaensis]CAG9126175.1 unnamed protein product [Bursaphelenchus okinawaensis]
MPVDGRNNFLDSIKFYEDGNPEVKLLLENECNVLYECRICQKVFKTIISLVSHKRTVCKDSCNVEALTEKNEFLKKLQNELKKSKDGNFEIANFCRQGKTNLLSILAERREYLGTGTFGYPSKSVPLSTFQHGYQLTEKPGTTDKVVVVLPQDSSTSYGEMRLRKRRVDERYTELYPEQVDLLTKIPDEIMQYADVNTFSCKHPKCKGMRAFIDFEILTYHLCISHQPEGMEMAPLCYFCSKKFTSFIRLKNHLKTSHSQIRIRHCNSRGRFQQRTKKKPERSSLSPNNFATCFEDEINAILESQESATSETSINSSPVKQKLPRKLSPKKKMVKTPAKKIESLDEQISVIVANAVNRSQEESMEEEEIDNQLNISDRKKKDKAKPILKRQISEESEGSSDTPITLIAGREPRARLVNKKFTNDYVLPKKFKPVNMDEDVEFRNSQEAMERESSVPKRKMKIKKPERAQSNPVNDRPELTILTTMKEEPVSDPASPIPTTDFVLPTMTEVTVKVSPSKHHKPEVEFGRNDPFTGKPRSNLGSANNSPLKTFFPSALIGAHKETETLNTPNKSTGASASQESRGEAASRRKQNYAALNKDKEPADDVKLIQVSGEKPCRPDDLLSLPVMLSQTQRKMFFEPLKPLFSEKEAKLGRDGLHQCAECGQTCRNLTEGQKHMIGHVRAIRLKCSLCDVGAFFCADIRKHLMYRYCENIHLAPKEMIDSGTPCMSPQTADKLIKIADPNNPGRAVYTSGKIITSESPNPYYPDPKIENILLGSVRPLMKSLSNKKISIIRKINPHKPLNDQNPSTSSPSHVPEMGPKIELRPVLTRPTVQTKSADQKTDEEFNPASEIPMTIRLGRNTPATSSS